MLSWRRWEFSRKDSIAPGHLPRCGWPLTKRTGSNSTGVTTRSGEENETYKRIDPTVIAMFKQE